MDFGALMGVRRLSIQALVCLTLMTGLLATEAAPANPRHQLNQKGYRFSSNDFVKSAENGDLSAVKLFIDAGMDVNAVNRGRETALVRADEAGQVKVVVHLLGRGAKTREGEFTAVTYITAVEAGNTRLETLLYKHGMNRDFALTLLAERNLTQAAMRLMGEGANPFSNRGRQALVFAAERENLRLIEIMVERGTPKDRPGLLNAPLVMAASLGNIELTLFLLGKGANANDPRAGTAVNGPTALGEAAAAGNARMVALLLNHGADPNLSWRDGGFSGSPLISAAREGHSEVVRLLLDKGASARIQVITVDGNYNALSMASRVGHKKVVALLSKSIREKPPLSQAQPVKTPLVKTQPVKTQPVKNPSGRQVAREILNGKIRALEAHLLLDHLKGLNFDQLRIVRNTIFARYGYPFKSSDLQQHFARFPWYRRGDRGLALSRLTQTDKDNIEMVKSFENQR